MTTSSCKSLDSSSLAFFASSTSSFITFAGVLGISVFGNSFVLGVSFSFSTIGSFLPTSLRGSISSGNSDLVSVSFIFNAFLVLPKLL